MYSAVFRPIESQSDYNPMTRRTPATPHAPQAEPYFVTWEEGDTVKKGLAIAQASRALHRTEPIVRTHATDIFRNIAGNNTSVRDNYTRQDYDYLRPDSALPKTVADAIHRSSRAYDEHGIVRNVFDMMSDFTIQGISIYHPNETIQQFYRNWFKKVKGVERSERFVNLLFKHANIIVERATGKIGAAKEKQMRTEGADLDTNDETPVVRREIPWRYTFLNPLALSVLSEELATLIGSENYIFQVKIPPKIKAAIKKKKKSKDEQLIISLLPDGVLDAVNSDQSKFTLDPKKVRCFFYRKDDWDVWAKPLLLPILKDLDILERMKLADMSALDGAISCIRVWKLGSLKDKMMPTPAGIARLAEMLANNVGGGVMDLVWDAAIELIETSTEVHKFLGESKYAAILAQIFAGLGIPPTLVGSSSEGGFTNNAISLKTLMERLNYARSILIEFWEEEIRIVQKAMGFRFPATIGFDRMTLMDEQQEQALMIQLLDRMGMSLETIQEMFGLNPEIEGIRIKREERKRSAGTMPRKAGAFHSDTAHELKKIVAGTHTLTPTQLGLDIPERKPGEESPAEAQNKLAVKLSKAKPAVAPAGAIQGKKPKGQAGQGRPASSKDSTKRKTKLVKPRTKASETFMSTFAWAEYAQGMIADTTSSAYLGSLKKKSLRELTTAEAKAFEEFKFNMLFNVTPFQPIQQEEIVAAVEKPLQVPEQVQQLMRATIANYVETNGGQPSTEMIRRFQSGVFACWQGDYEDADEEDDSLAA